MHEDQLQVRSDLALWSLLMFIGAIIVVAGLVSFVRQAAVRSRLPFALGLLAAAILCGIVLMGFLSVRVKVSSSPVNQVARQASKSSVSDVAHPEIIDVATSSNTSTDDSVKSPLPEWTQRNPIRDGSRRLVVINGGRFASEDEAELHALDQALIVVAQEFQHLDPQRQGTRLPIHREEIQRTAIKQRFLETREHDFGKSKGLMYQVWLQLELTPDLAQHIAAPWRQAAVEARVRTLTGCGIWLTAVAGAISFAFRYDTARQGRHRTALCVTVIAVAAGSLLLLA